MTAFLIPFHLGHNSLVLRVLWGPIDQYTSSLVWEERNRTNRGRIGQIPSFPPSPSLPSLPSFPSQWLPPDRMGPTREQHAICYGILRGRARVAVGAAHGRVANPRALDRACQKKKGGEKGVNRRRVQAPLSIRWMQACKMSNHHGACGAV